MNECGGHRIQRVPPTERRGRVHTSTVTVAVLDHSIQVDPKFLKRKDDDFRVEWFSGTGKGGQHRNRHMNSCRYIHIPTGLMASRQSRSRESNINDAKADLITRLDEQIRIETYEKLSLTRKTQMGSGERGDKIRTLQFQNDCAKDHRNGKKITCSQYMKGFMD